MVQIWIPVRTWGWIACDVSPGPGPVTPIGTSESGCVMCPVNACCFNCR